MGEMIWVAYCKFNGEEVENAFQGTDTENHHSEFTMAQIWFTLNA